MARLPALTLTFVLASAASAAAQPPPVVPVTPTGWSVTPAGSVATIKVGPGLAGPWGVAMAPDGSRFLVTSSGSSNRFETVEQFVVGSLDRSSLVPYDGATGASVFYGIAYSPDGTRAWASGGGQNVVHVYDVGPRPARDRPDPDAVLPGRPRLRPDAPGAASTSPTTSAARRSPAPPGPARPHGHGDRPANQGHERSTSACRSTPRRRVRPQRHARPT